MLNNVIERRGLILIGCLWIIVSLLLAEVYSQELNCDVNVNNETTRILTVCKLMKEKLNSSSKVMYPFEAGYEESISHYAITSSIRSLCSVEPSTVDDVSMILKLIGEYGVPFAIKGGGHAFNPGFSSTIGVHMSMSQFHDVIYHHANESVDFGSGLIWDDVFESLEPFNVSVVGGRISGVGVAGFILGGGYGWKSNQYGLSIDNIYEYELVTPNGSVVNVNKDSYPDLFFGLKGGFNNFGIVTKFSMRTVPQTQVFAGILSYKQSDLNAIVQAMDNFQMTNKDPKAAIAAFLTVQSGEIMLILYVYYDSPKDINGIFNEFLAINHTGHIQTQSLSSFIKTTRLSPMKQKKRCRTTTVSITSISHRFVQSLVNHAMYLNGTLGRRSGASIVFGIEPFISTYLDNSEGGGYPHSSSSNPLFPLLIAFNWDSSVDDEMFVNELKSTFDVVLQLALADGQDVGGSKQILYSNYASDQVSLSQLYGQNLPQLQRIRQTWDPNNIMYLTGGFKF